MVELAALHKKPAVAKCQPIVMTNFKNNPPKALVFRDQLRVRQKDKRFGKQTFNSIFVHTLR